MARSPHDQDVVAVEDGDGHGDHEPHVIGHGTSRSEHRAKGKFSSFLQTFGSIGRLLPTIRIRTDRERLFPMGRTLHEEPSEV